MKKNLIASAIAATLLAAPFAASAGEAELLARIDKMAAELEQLKAELKASQQKTAVIEQKQQELASAAAPAVAPAPAPAPSAPVMASGPTTIIGGYGEINYNRPSKNASAAQTDVRRAVIGIEHRFDEKTKLVSEFEWEHAIASASDSGESAIEQLYVERQFGNGLRGKAGLFLIPAGLLNTSHEPTAYYGVERNFVETAIIPSTWREAGIGLSGDTAEGLSWDAGITTGFDLGKWDAASSEGRESPLGAIHQEGQLAKSRDLSVHGALNWRGVPGLLLGGSLFSGKVGHKTEGYTANDARVTVYDLHARYTPGLWDLAAVYARGQISNTAALNLTLVGNPTPVPKAFAGWYLQAAYQAYKADDYVLSPFVRYEQYNTAKSYEALPQGLGVAALPDEKVTTVGANLKVGEGVVLKADYQKFKEDKTRDRLNLGVGFSY
ncbi:hypothetical protein [Duganella qianjiadongensis]|uniref:Porin n=1 Tax=Duganella qianjiadongensis TaxID=2692176 RepID=A0ABW9VIV0_9BURK|nr:hypothetical protein [Duganella qianjiadongensis]MYM39416.1 hypothetical protein [Duganella qianjiadongensis]